MNIEELKQSGRIIFECIAGSTLYNLRLPDKSDTDIRGVYLNPYTEYLGLKEPEPQIQDDKHDTVYYSLKRFFELLKTANPNIIELNFVPKELSTIWTPTWQSLYDHRSIFMTKQAYYSHFNYANDQIGRAKGKNKKVHNPQPETMPRKEDFCRIIDMNDICNLSISLKEIVLTTVTMTDCDLNAFPFRPVPLKETDINLEHIHVSSLEHVPNTYRMYYYGEGAKGVFRGDQMLCCESIPMDDEKSRFRGLLIYNKDEFDKALKAWHSYHDWLSNRNDARWIDQEKGLIDFDVKNMAHCYRLILSCENILKNGEPIVRFDGEAREYLMKIRKGEFTYDEIMKDVEDKRLLLKELLDKTSLPEDVNFEQVDKLYREISQVLFTEYPIWKF